jgi:hypothetical protein
MTNAACCRVICLLLAPFAMIYAIEGAENPWYKEYGLWGPQGVRDLLDGEVGESPCLYPVRPLSR